MKYVITLFLIFILFSGLILSQENNKSIQSPYESLIEKLNNIEGHNKYDANSIHEKEFLATITINDKHLKILESLESKFNNLKDSNNPDSRTIQSEKVLADGFLLVESIGQSWDGTAWVNSYRYTNLYDGRNNRVQETYQNWDVPSVSWVNSSRYLYSYDANDNQIEYIYQNWSGTAWDNYSRYLYTYDVNNNNTEYIYQNWSGGAWTNSSRTLYTYNVNNKVTLRIYQNWSGSAWVDNSRNTYTYDSNNNLIEQIYQNWSGSAWVNDSKYSYTFDANNNQIQQISQTWNGSAWINSYRYSYTYDSNNNRTEYLYQSWDVTVWKNDSRYQLAYDANNNLLEFIYQTWDISVWKNFSRSLYTYNTNNDPIEYLSQTWNVSFWENNYKSTVTYDSNNNYTEQLTQSWDVPTTSWINQNRYLYTWASETSIVITSPNGGEKWPVGTTKNITWTSSNIANIKLQYSTNNGTSWMNITNVSASAGSYSWTIPNTISTNCKVLISDVSNSSVFDESDSIFSIIPAPAVTVISPNGGESWEVGSSNSITWTSVSIDSVKIEYSTNNGTNWVTIISSAPNNGSYSWTIPNTPSTNCKVRVSDASNAAIVDQSDNVFTIIVPVTPFINVTSPNGGEIWQVGTSQSITWNSNYVTNVRIDYTTTGTDLINIITSTAASAGSFTWVVPNTPTTICKVIISDVSNPTINDFSDNVFTISVPVTPVVTVTSPNGGENWEVGSTKNITWISSNVAEVKIEYSTNNGTNWTNIIASTAASSGSYNWTVPNTVSTNCKVQISDTSNASVTDQSDNVFNIFTYPDTVKIVKVYSFGDPTNTSSYQMIGLPGANNLSLGNVLTGTPGPTGDWRAFWDNGAESNYMVPFDGTSTFNFTPGRAFWIISKNQISLNQDINAVALSSDNTYSIAIHKGWNLISNPFDKSIPWSSVQNSNPGENQPLHYFQSGSYISPNPTQLEPYKGYYFKVTDSTRTTLKIPYVSTTPLPKNNSANLSELEIALSIDGVQKSSISAGVLEDAKQGIDAFDIFSPPSQFCDVSMSLQNNELKTNYKNLQKDYRPEIGEGQEFNFSIKNLSDKTLNLLVSGMDNFKDYEIFLVDKRLSKLYDLKKVNSFEVKANTIDRQYTLLIGTEEFILQTKIDLIPREFALFQNYPNPFNPATRIQFSLPEQSSVSLKIYNILGELVADLINNQTFEAGYQEVTFDGSQLASGIYLYKLQTNSSGRQSFSEVKKMILVK